MPRSNNRERRTRGGRPILDLSPADRALYEIMKDMPLNKGDMLLLGPQSVKILTTEGMFQGVLPDKYVFRKGEW